MKNKSSNWIQGAIKNPGAFHSYCNSKGYKKVTKSCIEEGLKSKDPKVRKRAALAKTLMGFS